MRHPELLASALTLTLLSGCASMTPGKGFDDVHRSVAERTGLNPRWNNGTKEDEEARAAVAALLDKELNADDAVQIALLNNHELQAVYEDLNISQAELVRAGLLKNPVFNADVRLGLSGFGPGVDLGVLQDFVSLLAMPLKKGRAQAAFEAAKLRVTAAVIDAGFEVEAGFYDYQAAAQSREMRASVLQATTASLALAQRLRAAGNFRKLDVLNEQTLCEQARVELAAAESRETAARERLNALMGLWGSQTGWRAVPRLPEVPEEIPGESGLEARAITASLDLAILRRDTEIAARTLGIAENFAWLDGAAAGGAGQRELDGPWSIGPAIGVPIPIFDQGQAAAGAAQASYRQAVQRTYSRAVEIRARVRAAYAAVVASHDLVGYYQRTMLPLRQRVLDETQLQYNAMQVSAFQLLQARRDQIGAGAEYVSAIHEYWLARAALDQILAGRTTQFEKSESMSNPVSTTPGPTGSGEPQ